MQRCRDERLAANPARVITRLFVPGQEGFEHHDSRATEVLKRILALDDEEVKRSYDDIAARFEHRHRDLTATFEAHAAVLSERLRPDNDLSDTRRLLLGAAFTNEYAIEGAALCNPSVVAHPDQSGVADGSLRFVMSVRGIGEGHRSSIGFRTGVVDADGRASIDEPSAFATVGTSGPTQFDAAIFRGELHRLDPGIDNADYVLDALGPEFSLTDLDDQLERLHLQSRTRKHVERTIALFRNVADRIYRIAFADHIPLSERVLFPTMGAESHGMEDTRLVRFVDDDGQVTYYGTYTAYDGDHISHQLLETADFGEFRSSPVMGAAAANKGLALFPRRIDGRFAALSRFDRETNAVAFADHPRLWETAVTFQVPTHAWEVLQLGNCGSPIETEAGWLVITHGVGPMRTYSIGALLLDIDDPTRVIGQLPEPLLSPDASEQNGYVPNVVYSCGSLVHGDTLVLPYGIGDSAIGVASIVLSELLDALV